MALRGDFWAYKPHPKQALFHQMTERLRIFAGGNRSGKSVGGFAEDVATAIGISRLCTEGKIPVPNHGWICSQSFKVSKFIAEAHVRKLLPKGTKIEWDAINRVMTLPNGSTIGFMSYDAGASKFASDSKHWIHLDEPPPEDIYAECQMRLLDTKGFMWITMTPVEGKSCWTYDKFQQPWENCDIPRDEETGERDFDMIKVTTYENPHIDPKEIERKKRGLSKFEIASRVYGDYDTPEGLIFPEFSTSIHVAKHEALPIPRANWPCVVGMDHGASKKAKGHTSAYLAFLRPDGVLQIHDEYYQMVGRPAAFHAVALRRLPPDGIKMPVVYLDRTATQFRLELQLQGLAVTEANNDHNQGFSRMRDLFAIDAEQKTAIVISERCKHLIRDLQRYTWDGDHAHTHSVDGFRYTVMAAPRRAIKQLGRVGMTLEEEVAADIERIFSQGKRERRYAEYGEAGMG